jgi:hypothetical protein
VTIATTTIHPPSVSTRPTLCPTTIAYLPIVNFDHRSIAATGCRPSLQLPLSSPQALPLLRILSVTQC